MEYHNNLNKIDIFEIKKIRNKNNVIKLHKLMVYLPHEIRAPGRATIGNTPNKSITQSVAKNTLSPRVGR